VCGKEVEGAGDPTPFVELLMVSSSVLGVRFANELWLLGKRSRCGSVPPSAVWPVAK